MHPHGSLYGHTRQASACPPSPPYPPGIRHVSSHAYHSIRQASARPPSPSLPPGTRTASASPPSPPHLPGTRHASTHPRTQSPPLHYSHNDGFGDMAAHLHSPGGSHDGDTQIPSVYLQSSPQDLGTSTAPGGFSHHHFQSFLPPVSRNASIRARSPSPSGAFLHIQPSNPGPIDSAPKKRKQMTPSSGDEAEADLSTNLPLKSHQPLKAPPRLKRAQPFKTPRRPPPANPPQTRLRSQAARPIIITTEATPGEPSIRRRPGLRQLQAGKLGSK
jgi:hypothetical protein